MRCRGQRDEIADPDFVGEHGAGGEHFHAGDHDAGIVLADDAQRRHWDVLAMIEFRIARGLRRHHGVNGVDIVVADMTIIGEQIIGMTAGGLQLVGLHRHAGDERRNVIG